MLARAVRDRPVRQRASSIVDWLISIGTTMEGGRKTCGREAAIGADPVRAMWNKGFLKTGPALAASALLLAACGGTPPVTINVTKSVAIEHGREALELARHHFGTHDVTAAQIVEMFPKAIAHDKLRDWWKAEVVGENAQVSFLVISDEYRDAHPDVTYPLMGEEKEKSHSLKDGSDHTSTHDTTHGTKATESDTQDSVPAGSEQGLSNDEAVVPAASSESTLPGAVLDDVLNGGTIPTTTTPLATTTSAAPTTTTTTQPPREDTDRLGLPANAFKVAVAACVKEIAGEMRVRGGECPAEKEKDHSDHAAPHWSYSGDTGESHWGDLHEEWEACAVGREQSPVDLSKATSAIVEGPEVRYNATAGEASDNGHTLKIAFELGSSIEVRGALYRLVELHYHARSEHTLDGKPYPLELHFVHKSFNGDVAVIGVLVEEGASANEKWQPLIAGLASAPRGGGPAEVAKLQLQTLIEGEPRVYRYSGSLTTPPCSEGVVWSVLADPVQLSAKQIRTLTKRYDANARSVQPLGERQLLIEEASK